MNADGRWGRVQLAIRHDAAAALGRDRHARAPPISASTSTGSPRPFSRCSTGERSARPMSTTAPSTSTSSRRPSHQRPGDLANIFMKTGDGRFVPLSSIATIKEEAVAHDARRGTSRVRSPCPPTCPRLLDQAGLGPDAGVRRGKLPDGVRLVPLAEAATLEETSSGLAIVFGFAIVVVFLVLAAQFESFVSALIIIATVPFGVAAHSLRDGLLRRDAEPLLKPDRAGAPRRHHGQERHLIVEFANQLREEGRSVREAIEEASIIRLRPVMMTMIATIVGGVPLIFSAARAPRRASRSATSSSAASGWRRSPRFPDAGRLPRAGPPHQAAGRGRGAAARDLAAAEGAWQRRRGDAGGVSR